MFELERTQKAKKQSRNIHLSSQRQTKNVLKTWHWFLYFFTESIQNLLNDKFRLHFLELQQGTNNMGSMEISD